MTLLNVKEQSNAVDEEDDLCMDLGDETQGSIGENIKAANTMLGNSKNKGRLLDKWTTFLSENPATAFMHELRSTHVCFIKMSTQLRRTAKDTTSVAALLGDGDSHEQAKRLIDWITDDVLVPNLPKDLFAFAELVWHILDQKHIEGSLAATLAKREDCKGLAEVVPKLWDDMPSLVAFMQSRARYFFAIMKDAADQILTNDITNNCVKLFAANEHFFAVLGGSGNDAAFAALIQKFFKVRAAPDEQQ